MPHTVRFKAIVVVFGLVLANGLASPRTQAAAFCGATSPFLDPPQGESAPPPRVRILAPGVQGKPIVGSLIAMDGASFTLTVEGAQAPLVVPRQAIESLEISTGPGWSRTRGAVVGAAIGTGVAVLVAAGVAYEARGSHSENSGGDILQMVATVTVPLFALLGTAARPHESWGPAPELAAPSPQVSLAIQPARRGAGLGLRIGF